MSRVLAVAQRESETPLHYTWAFPGSPIKVRLALDVVERMQSHSGEHGLLWGTSAGQTTEIRDFNAVPGSGQPSVSEVSTAIPSSRKAEVLGYYRIHHEGTLHLNDADLALAQVLFSQPYQVFLLIQPSETGPATATFFFWDEGRMCGDFPFLEFPWDATLLAAAERQRSEAMQKKSAPKPQPVDVVIPADPTPPKKPAARSRSRSLAFMASLFLASTLVTVLALRFLSLKSRELNSSASPIPEASAKQIPLGLQAERQNGDLKLTWNRDSAVVRSAASGLLSIEDGEERYAIQLGSAQIRNASILYAPKSDRIQVQLTVQGQDPISESVIVILPKSGNSHVQTFATASKVVPATPVSATKPLSGAPSAPPPSNVTPPDMTSAHAPPKPFALPPVRQERASSTSTNLPDAPPAVASQTAVTTNMASGLVSPAIAPPPLPAKPAPPLPATSVVQPPPSEPAPVPVPESQPSSPSSVYYPPAVIASTTPVYPAEFRSMSLPVKLIELKVSLDDKGRMVKAEALPPKAWTPNAMIKSALEAVQRWKFQPARKGNQTIPSEMVLQFVFKSPQ